MKKTQLAARYITFFLILLFGIAIGAKSAGVDTFRVTLSVAALGLLAFLHVSMMVVSRRAW